MTAAVPLFLQRTQPWLRPARDWSSAASRPLNRTRRCNWLWGITPTEKPIDSKGGGVICRCRWAPPTTLYDWTVTFSCMKWPHMAMSASTIGRRPANPSLRSAAARRLCLDGVYPQPRIWTREYGHITTSHTFMSLQTSPPRCPLLLSRTCASG